MNIDIPDFALVLLVGASGSGKSTFAARHFLPTETVSSDRARAWVLDDETDQDATPDAFELLHAVVEKRLKHRRLTVVDATNVQPGARRSLLALAKRWHALSIAIVFDLPEAVAVARNAARPDRAFGPGPVRRQMQDLKRSLKGLQKEGLRYVHRLDSVEAVDAVTLTRTPLWTDRRFDTGPFDIIGDVHGCADELELLLAKLEYAVAWDGKDVRVVPPPGRRAIFVGDLVDRGPRSPDVLRLVRSMVADGGALAVAGNHDAKLQRHLAGRAVKIGHGLERTIAQLAEEPPEFSAEMRRWLDDLRSHYVLDGGKLVVAHAGLKEEMQGRAGGAVRAFAMYGETSGELDAYGMPVRLNWALDYKGRAKVVHGHTPVVTPAGVNGTLCIDTGCCFGGSLTALRYPEMELVSVPAAAVYFEPVRPLAPEAPAADPSAAGQLDIADVLGRQAVETRLLGPVVVPAENAAAALETMSRFAVDPRWLIHLPPTMSPCETSKRDGWLERPEEALAYYASKGVSTVVAEEKHMGSRALVVLCRDGDAAARRFGTDDGAAGIVLSRGGRRFFTDAALETTVLARLGTAMAGAGLWEELETDWVLWDAEILPWSLKAGALIDDLYAPVATAATAGLSALDAALAAATARGVAVEDLAATTAVRLDNARRYRTAYSAYAAPFAGIDDLRVAPFHLLASEGRVHSDRDHLWHMAQAHRLAEADPALVKATAYRRIALDDPADVAATVQWWEDLTAAGGEGMVVKPLDFITRTARGLVQPAVKCRGREYLRIIYGPDYDLPDNLDRLKKRHLGQKRSMASREFALGLEALHRFVEHAPLTQVHRCVFGVLAMETEPVDPRL